MTTWVRLVGCLGNALCTIGRVGEWLVGWRNAHYDYERQARRKPKP